MNHEIARSYLCIVIQFRTWRSNISLIQMFSLGFKKETSFYQAKLNEEILLEFLLKQFYSMKLHFKYLILEHGNKNILSGQSNKVLTPLPLAVIFTCSLRKKLQFILFRKILAHLWERIFYTINHTDSFKTCFVERKL